MVPRMDPAAFVEDVAADDWCWASSNCLVWLVEWVDLVQGAARAEAWRAMGLDERGARRLLKEAGGLVAFVDREATKAGLVRINPEDARDGDIGAVAATVAIGPERPLDPEGKTFNRRTVTLPTGALRCGGMWALRVRDGIFVAPCRALAAWRV